MSTEINTHAVKFPSKEMTFVGVRVYSAMSSVQKIKKKNKKKKTKNKKKTADDH